MALTVEDEARLRELTTEKDQRMEELETFGSEGNFPRARDTAKRLEEIVGEIAQIRSRAKGVNLVGRKTVQG